MHIDILDKGTLGAEEQPQSCSSKERPPARFAQSAVTVPSNGDSTAPLVRLSGQHMRREDDSIVHASCP